MPKANQTACLWSVIPGQSSSAPEHVVNCVYTYEWFRPQRLTTEWFRTYGLLNQLSEFNFLGMLLLDLEIRSW